MHIKVKNFRCYEDGEFDLGTSGMTLLSASSGAGKTTLLMAVNFALFGTGTKVVRHGKTSCSVELRINDLHVVRTKRPNRLVVNMIQDGISIQYEDKAGQDIIDKIFSDTYETAGYISHNALNTFVLMSPSDKLSFLEKFAFKDVELGKLKSRCKSFIAETNEKFIRATSNLELSSSILNSMEKPLVFPFPVKCRKSDIEKVTRGEKVKLNNRLKSLSKITNKKESLQDELQAVTRLASIISDEITLQKSADKSIQESEFIISSSDGYDQKLKEYKEQLKSIEHHKKRQYIFDSIKEKKYTLESIREKELDTLSKKISSLVIWEEYTLSELEESLQWYKSHLAALKKASHIKSLIPKTVDIEGLKDELSKAKTELETAQIGVQYSCPKCNSSLILSRGELKRHEDGKKPVTKEEVDLLKRKVEQLDKKLTVEINNIDRKEKLIKDLDTCLEPYIEDGKGETIESLESSIEYLESYKTENLSKEKEFNILQGKMERNEMSATYNQLFAELESLKNSLTRIPEASLPDFDEDTIRTLIAEQTHLKNSRETAIAVKEDSVRTLKKSKNKVGTVEALHNEKYGSLRTTEEIFLELEDLNSEIKRLEKECETLRLRCSEIEYWHQNNEALQSYNKAESRVNEMMKEEKESRLMYTAATTLKTKIAEAESIAMKSVIDSINMHAHVYLDSFFPDQPIVVKLNPYKQGKKTLKPQINIEVEYKGMECDISSLSGGEISRVVLAFTLALAEMFNIPMIMLDECTANLDQEMTNTVLAGIKENFNNKLVLVVAHQVVTGSFDHILTLK